jgi:predicted MPP superfamily phosphohydrolase
MSHSHFMIFSSSKVKRNNRQLSVWIIIIFSVIILLPLLSCNENFKRYSKAIKVNEYAFAVASDPQLFWGTLENWQQTIRDINEMHPDFVIVCGDMTNNPGNKEEIAAYWENAAKLSAGIKLYNVPGNHDLQSEPTLESIELYKKNFGKPYYSFEHKNSLFIVLESSSMKNPTEKTTPLVIEQMRWLKKILSDSDKMNYANKFVFMHHPVILKDINEKEEYFNLPVAVRNELLELFEAHNVKIVFSGHLHQDRVVKLKNVELVITGSCGKALADSSLGFRIVHVMGNNTQHSYYKF